MIQTKPLFGNIAKTFPCGELVLSETTYAPFAELSEHSHDFAYFCFVLRGSYAEKLAGKEYICQPLTLIFHEQKDSHSDQFHQNGGVCFNIQLGNSLINRVNDYAKTPKISKVFNDFSASSIVKKLHREFLQPDDFSPLAIEGIVLEIFAEISRESARSEHLPKWLKTTEELLHEHFRENLSLNYIATTVGKHPVHLAREFRKNFRCTVGEYIRQLRVNFAIKELSKSHASLSEIALDAGFAQQSHFTKTFKSLTGKTPNEFRDSLRRLR